MGRVIAFLSAGGRWAWFVLSDYSGKMGSVCAVRAAVGSVGRASDVLAAVGRWTGFLLF